MKEIRERVDCALRNMETRFSYCAMFVFGKTVGYR
jgi:hypothetical protein